MNTDLESKTRSSLRRKDIKLGSFFAQIWSYRNSPNLTVKSILLVVLVILVVILYSRIESGNKYEAISKLGQGISTCWDNFKKESCDLNNPIGPFCKQLL